MRLFALAAAAAALLVTTADAASVTSRIVKIDTKDRVLHLEDRTAMIVGPDIDLATLKPAMKVEIVANLDEDGFGPATKVTPVK